jgi:sigma-B regulation protein RsbU (phosphoserine phosphatase)
VTEAAPRADRLQSLLDVSMALATQVDLDSLLQVILDQARSVMQAERSTLYVYDPGQDALVSRVSEGAARGLAIRVPLGTGIAGHVGATRELVNIPDAYADPRFNPEVDRKGGFRTRSILTAPLLSHDGRLMGVIQLLNKSTGEPFSAEDEVLVRAFASHAGVALERARLVEEALEKQRIEEGLRLAHDIQMGMLPRRFPASPVLEIDAALAPAKTVGGDFYDVLERLTFSDRPPYAAQDGRIWFAIGDVSGKGIGAALFMAVTRTMFRAAAGAGAPDPAAVLFQVNNELAKDNERAMFVTVFAGLYDPATGVLEYANGGHNPPYVLRASGALETLPNAASPALGVMEDLPFANAEVRLGPGDALVAYTDGVNEAQNPRGELYGTPRFEAWLRAAAGRPVPELVKSLIAEIDRFEEGAAPADDITVLAFRRLAG